MDENDRSVRLMRVWLYHIRFSFFRIDRSEGLGVDVQIEIISLVSRNKATVEI